MPDVAHPRPPAQPARLELVSVDLACGHQRHVDPGIGSLVVAGLIDHMWCLRCAADQLTTTTTTDGAAATEGA
ncbi:hypothetical protein [Pimelobacter simplex]|uniref:hypothetical protein n=1 Tax=Nocardioides simplex TaxID=2045 RepID=UPI0021501A50|nr:hypothetical protein [Pimelobacter simplex]UUW88447.1 hypothetical protein M0M43_22270 [Pimelobacter simplex]UUW97951.1 hypothetical protein M0M48_10915 [Pimelobacter simplex]